MSILNNYIFGQIGRTAIALTIGLALLILLAQSLRFLDIMISAGASPTVFFQLLGLSLPRLIEILLPISFGISVILIILKLQNDQEMVIIQATGNNIWKITMPVIKTAFYCAAFLIFMVVWLTPASLATLQSERHSIRAQFSLSLLQEGVFNFIGNDIMVYFESRDPSGHLNNLILRDQRNEERPYILLADQGTLITDGSEYRLNVTNGRRQELNKQSQVIDQLTFSAYEIVLPKTIRALDPRWKEPEERTLYELLFPQTISIYDRNNQDDLTVEIHKRFITPLLPFSFALPILAFILALYKPRKSNVGTLVLGLLLILFIQIIIFFSVSMARDNVWAIPLIYITALVPIFIGLYYLFPQKRVKYNSGSQKAVS